jgi:hypothetical protein
LRAGCFAPSQTNSSVREKSIVTIGERASSWARATAIAVAATVAAGATDGYWAGVRTQTDASVTGRQKELVNRPGCWTESGYDLRSLCGVDGAAE